uniref:endo-1,4-beta-xylanase n=1 Tax=Mesosa myops TaxID=993118 RepID=A0A6F7XL44_9CUCU|nr:endo-1,4-beta-endoxylanase [Mesosa myops]
MLKLLILLTILGSIAAHLKDNANQIYIGTALSPSHFSDAQYQSIAAAEFNSLTPENEMKWDAVEPSQGNYNYGQADQLVQFAQQNGMKIRGHTLVWHSQVPGWVNGLSGDTLHQVMIDHITNEVTRYKGSIYAWDVVNEMFNEDGSYRQSIWYNNFQTQFVADAFTAAAAADPGAKLYINDYNIESINGKSTGLLNLVTQLKSQGVPIHGVGFQAHLAVGQIPSDLAANLQRFTALGLEVAITELDIKQNGQSQDAQAQAYTQVINACTSTSGCVGVTIWGFTDKYSWISSDNACPWDGNYQAKPAVSAIEQALK